MCAMGPQGQCSLSRCGVLHTDNYFCFEISEKELNCCNIFCFWEKACSEKKVWFFIFIFTFLFFFPTCCPLFTALHCFASFFTLPLTRKFSQVLPKKKKTTQNWNWYSQCISQSLFINILSPRDRSVLSDHPTKKEIMWQKKWIMLCLYGCLGEEKVQHCISQHQYLILVAKDLAVHTSFLSSCFETIITFGGSPTAVAAPPIFVKITSAIRTCLGSRLSTSQSLWHKENEINLFPYD